MDLLWQTLLADGHAWGDHEPPRFDVLRRVRRQIRRRGERYSTDDSTSCSDACVSEAEDDMRVEHDRGLGGRVQPTLSRWLDC